MKHLTTTLSSTFFDQYLTIISSSGTLERRSINSLFGTAWGLRILLRNLFVPHNISKYLIGMKYSTTVAAKSMIVAIQDRYGTVKLNVLKHNMILRRIKTEFLFSLVKAWSIKINKNQFFILWCIYHSDCIIILILTINVIDDIWFQLIQLAI